MTTEAKENFSKILIVFRYYVKRIKKTLLSDLLWHVAGTPLSAGPSPKGPSAKKVYIRYVIHIHTVRR